MAHYCLDAIMGFMQGRGLIVSYWYKLQRLIAITIMGIQNHRVWIRVRVRVRVRVGLRVGLRDRVRVGIRVGIRVGLRVALRVGVRVKVDYKNKLPSPQKEIEG